MMKLGVKNLVDVFGWMNVRARDIAYSMGNATASLLNICKVMQATGKIQSLMGPFEMAASAIFQRPITGSTGRPFRPLNFINSREPR